MAEFTSTIQKSEGNVWQLYFTVPKAIALPFIDGANKRIKCALNQKVTYQAALMPFGNGDFYVLLNKKNQQLAGVELFDEVSVVLEKDKSEYGLEVAPEIELVFAEDQEVFRLFKQLTMGKQRSLIYWMGNVKNPDIRVERTVVALEHLKKNNGAIDYKQLNMEIKEANALRKMK